MKTKVKEYPSDIFASPSLLYSNAESLSMDNNGQATPGSLKDAAS